MCYYGNVQKVQEIHLGLFFTGEDMTDKEAKEFYDSKMWKIVRKQVLNMDHYECQLCKSRGKYKKATVVHHVKHLKDHPELSLSIWDESDGNKRQLVSLCDECHNEVHPEKGIIDSKPPLTEEKW